MKQQFKTPGQLIREDLNYLKWTQQALCNALGVDRSVVSKLINDKLAVTPDRARSLEAVTGRDALEYVFAQAWLGFIREVKPQGFAVKRATRRKGEGK